MMWLKYRLAPSNDYRDNLLHLSSNRGGRAISRMGVVKVRRPHDGLKRHPDWFCCGNNSVTEMFEMPLNLGAKAD